MVAAGHTTDERTWRVYQTGETLVLNHDAVKGFTPHPYSLTLGQDGLARHQKPVRAARVVKKMPLGLAESKPPICCLLAVS